MPPRVSLVTFDLDGTLLGSTVFQVVGRELGHGDYIDYVDRLFFADVISLRAAFYAEYPLFLGETIADVHAALDEADWMADIADTADRLRKRGHDVWVVTDQPDWAASYLQRFGIEEGVCTRTTRWDGGDAVGAAVDITFEKTPALLGRLDEQGIEPDEVTHVGNGSNDVPVFEAVGSSVAFNPSSQAVAQAADGVVRSDSLAPVLDEIA